jgi:hypothetical protein
MCNRGAEWSDEDIPRLRDLAAGGTPTGVIALTGQKQSRTVPQGIEGVRQSLSPQFLKENEVIGNSHL